MATCRHCGKSGLFLKLTTMGVCEKCQFQISTIVNSRFRIYKESAEIIKNTDNPATLKKRIALIRVQLAIFLGYEKMNIFFMTPTAFEEINLLNSESDNYYLDCFQRGFDELAVKIANMKTPSAKLNNIEKFILQLEEYTSELNNKSALSVIQKKAEKLKESFSA